MFSPRFCGRFPVSPRGLGSGIHVAARDGNLPALRHFLRVAPERVHAKDPIGRWPQKTSVELRVCGWWWKGGLKVPEEIFKILKFGVNRNLDFSMLGFELPDY